MTAVLQNRRRNSSMVPGEWQLVTSYGSSGKDWLNDSGGETLIGYGGDDVYDLGSPIIIVVEEKDGGNDTIRAYCSYFLPANVEKLVIGAPHSKGLGNELANTLTSWSNMVTLNGRSGDDLLIDGTTNGNGRVIFSFSRGTGHDTIKNFDASGSNHDIIQLTDFGLEDFSQVKPVLSQSGSDVVLSLAPGDTVTIRNVAIDDLDSGDFYLQAPTTLIRTFSEDFDTLSLWDPKTGAGTWKTNYAWGNQSTTASRTIWGEEKSLFVDPSWKSAGLNPFVMGDGTVALRAERAAPEDLWALSGQTFTAGMLTTQKSFTQLYGYFEVRAEMPSVRGLWPTFWMVPAIHAQNPELDIAERMGNQYTQHTLHSADSKVTYTATTLESPGGMHSYGALWTPETITFFVDGMAVQRVATPSDMHQPMYMQLTMGVGGYHAGQVDDSFTHGDFVIDYVRAYSLTPALHPLASGVDSVPVEAAAAPVAAGAAAVIPHATAEGRPLPASYHGESTAPAVHSGSTHRAVDFDFYRLMNPDVASARVDPATHYAQYGWREGRDPSALFSTGYYLSTNPDVARAGVDPLQHYLDYGWKEGRDPSPLFSTNGYLELHPDVRAAGVNPLEHYLAFGAGEGRQITSFDPLSYAASYDDLARAFRFDAHAAATHYATYGFAEGRIIDFDPAQYLANYQDLRSVFGSSLEGGRNHFLQYGVDEHRLAEDPLDYVASFADLRTAFRGLDADALRLAGLTHYGLYGDVEGRRAGITFDPQQYLANYADLRSAYGTDHDSAAIHYIAWGASEHRLVADPLTYIASYGDLVTAFSGQSLEQLRASGLAHFQLYGDLEGRYSGIDFDAETYLANYADLRTAFADGHGGFNEAAATFHYVQYGHFEGRTGDVLIA